MSLRPDGITRCDRCGWDVDNAGIFMCAIVSDLNLDKMESVIYHFCRDHKVDDKMVSGCVHRVLSKANLKNYLGEKNG